jgi:hypothetical protein
MRFKSPPREYVSVRDLIALLAPVRKLPAQYFALSVCLICIVFAMPVRETPCTDTSFNMVRAKRRTVLESSAAPVFFVQVGVLFN